MVYVNIDRLRQIRAWSNVWDTVAPLSFVLDIWLGPESTSDTERCMIYFIVGEEKIQLQQLQLKCNVSCGSEQ